MSIIPGITIFLSASIIFLDLKIGATNLKIDENIINKFETDLANFQ